MPSQFEMKEKYRIEFYEQRQIVSMDFFSSGLSPIEHFVRHSIQIRRHSKFNGILMRISKSAWIRFWVFIEQSLHTKWRFVFTVYCVQQSQNVPSLAVDLSFQWVWDDNLLKWNWWRLTSNRTIKHTKTLQTHAE